MAKLGWRVRSLAWVLEHAPGGSVASMTPEQILKAQQRLAGHGKLTVGVTGGLAKGVRTENRVIAQDGQEVPVRIYRQRRSGRRWPGDHPFPRRRVEPGCAGSVRLAVQPGMHRRRRRRGVRGLPARAHLPLPDGRAGQRRGGELGGRERRGTGCRRRPDRRDGRQRRRQPGHRDHPDHAGPRRPEDLPSGTDVPGHRSADAGGIRSEQHCARGLADPVVGQHGDLPRPLSGPGRRRHRPDGLADPRRRPVRSAAGPDPGRRVRPAA